MLENDAPFTPHSPSIGGHALQAGQPPRLFRGKRRRDAFWPAALAEPASVPQDCSAGDLAEVLEFLKVSSSSVQAYMLPVFAAQNQCPLPVPLGRWMCMMTELKQS